MIERKYLTRDPTSPHPDLCQTAPVGMSTSLHSEILTHFQGTPEDDEEYILSVILFVSCLQILSQD